MKGDEGWVNCKFVVYSNFFVTELLLPEIICPNMSKLTLCILGKFDDFFYQFTTF